MAHSETVTFEAGETRKQVTVRSCDDNVDEPDAETFAARLTNASLNAVILLPEAFGTIDDNEDPPEISIQGVEGSARFAGAQGIEGTLLQFEARLSHPSSREITVDYKTVPLAGGAIEGHDYFKTSVVLIFDPGNTAPRSQPTVESIDDNVDEPDGELLGELFNVELSLPIGYPLAVISDASATGRILDNDGPPELSIIVASDDQDGVDEGDPVNFIVRLSHPTSRLVRVGVATGADTTDGAEQAGAGASCGPADVDVDYEEISQWDEYTFTVDLDTGATDESLIVWPLTVPSFAVPVTSCEDLVFESHETFRAHITSDDATVTLAPGDAEAIGTIIDDDQADDPSSMTPKPTEGEDPSSSSRASWTTTGWTKPRTTLVAVTAGSDVLLYRVHPAVGARRPTPYTRRPRTGLHRLHDLVAQTSPLTVTIEAGESESPPIIVGTTQRHCSTNTTSSSGWSTSSAESTTQNLGASRHHHRRRRPAAAHHHRRCRVPREGDGVEFTLTLVDPDDPDPDRPIAAGRAVTVDYTTLPRGTGQFSPTMEGTGCGPPAQAADAVDYIGVRDTVAAEDRTANWPLNTTTGETATTTTITIRTCPDGESEPDEKFLLQLGQTDSALVVTDYVDDRAGLHRDSATGTILGDCFALDDANPPAIELAGSFGFYREAGRDIGFGFSISPPLCEDGHIQWWNSDGSAEGTRSDAETKGDFEKVEEAEPRTVTIDAHKTSGTIWQSLFDDKIDEGNEKFMVTVNWRVGDGYMPESFAPVPEDDQRIDQEFEINIFDDDTATISVRPAALGEEAASAVEGETLEFEVWSDIPTARDIDVTYLTHDRTTVPINERADGGTCGPRPSATTRRRPRRPSLPTARSGSWPTPPPARRPRPRSRWTRVPTKRTTRARRPSWSNSPKPSTSPPTPPPPAASRPWAKRAPSAESSSRAAPIPPTAIGCISEIGP